MWTFGDPVFLSASISCRRRHVESFQRRRSVNYAPKRFRGCLQSVANTRWNLDGVVASMSKATLSAKLFRPAEANQRGITAGFKMFYVTRCLVFLSSVLLQFVIGSLSRICFMSVRLLMVSLINNPCILRLIDFNV